MYLNCHSYYSFLYGTLAPDELVHLGNKNDVNVLVLTDINNTSGWFDFLIACKKEGINGLVGIEFRHQNQLQFIGIPKSKRGRYELNYFLSEYLANGTYDPRKLDFNEVYVIFPFGTKSVHSLTENEFLGIRKSELTQIYAHECLQYPDKLVALNPITFRDASDLQTHQALQAMDQNTLLSKLDTHCMAKSDEYFQPLDKIVKAFNQYPFLIENANQLLSNCNMEMEEDFLYSPKNRKSFYENPAKDLEELRSLAFKGYKRRYGENKDALERIEKELAIIHELHFSAYFLITHDIIQYAGRKGYHHVGRGSGANSIVAYCIGISNVDPIELNLYFERFINPYRTSPPDFDIDFSWDERDDVIQYIFDKHGKEHVCLLATYSTFQDRSIIREMGKVFGLPKNEIDVLVNEPMAVHKHHEISKDINKIGERINEFPDHLSIHAGGILITEEPLYYYTALSMMPKGFPVCQFDMHVAESWGFYKYDILSQRGLGHIKEAVDIIRENRQISIDIHRPKDFFVDENVKNSLRSVNTIGCFYIESPAMRGLLTKLKCDEFKALVAASSIIRPGVAKSGMMREYITRSNDPKKAEYLHPKFKEVLAETFGVMVYQEDVIKIAHHFAGLDLGEADILRRGMSGKSRSKQDFIDIQDKYYQNCKKLGYSDELAHEVWRQIESFSGFSFCKAHSASFAVESYQSLYLKTYYPLEFMVAVINNFGGFYSTEQYVHEARISGAIIEAPCVNKSLYKTTINEDIIHLGFIHIQGLEANLGKSIVEERIRNGQYRSLGDFISRTQVTKEQLNLLIRIGALRFIGKSKQVLLWEKNNYLIHRVKGNTLNLLEANIQEDQLPQLETHPLEDIYDQMDLLGFPLISPFDLLQTKFRGEIKTKDMTSNIGNTVRMVGYFVAKKDTWTSKGDKMNFGTWTDDEGRFFDSVHFPQEANEYPFVGKGCYLMLGKVVEDFGFPSLEVKKMAKLPMIPDPRYGIKTS